MEKVYDDSVPKDEVRQIDILRYGYCYEPTAIQRTVAGEQPDPEHAASDHD